MLAELEGARAELDDLAGVHTRYPGVELSLRSGPLGDILAALDADEIDLGIGPLREDIPERFAVQALFTEELVLLTSPEHALAARPALPLDAVRDEPFVCLPAGSGLRGILDRAAAAAGFTPRVLFESPNLARLRELVAHGLGVALLARSIAGGPGPPVAVHGLLPAPLQRPVGLLHHRERGLPPAAAACRRYLAHRPVPGAPTAPAHPR